MKRLLLLFVFVFLVSVFIFVQRATPALAATTTLTSSADAGIQSTRDWNNGSNMWLVTNRLYDPQRKTRALVQFNLSSIPTNATVSSATFSIYLYDCGYSEGINDLNIGRNKDPWQENQVVWSNKPSFDTSTVLYKTAPCSTAPSYQIYDLTNFASNWIAGNYPNYGVQLYGDEDPVTSWSKNFFSREAAQNKPPKLVVNYTVPSQSTSNGNGDDDGTENGSSETDGDETVSTKDGVELATASATISADKTTPSASLTTDKKSKGISGARIALLVALVIILMAAVTGYIIYRRKKKLGDKKDKEPAKPEEKPSSQDQTEGKEENNSEDQPTK